MVRFCSLFNVVERSVTFLGGGTYSLSELRALGLGDLLCAMFEFSEKLSALDLRPNEIQLFAALVLVSAGKLKGPMLEIVCGLHSINHNMGLFSLHVLSLTST